jgi:hypothetical protein
MSRVRDHGRDAACHLRAVMEWEDPPNEFGGL